jgi:hypothetical protein
MNNCGVGKDFTVDTGSCLGKSDKLRFFFSFLVSNIWFVLSGDPYTIILSLPNSFCTEIYYSWYSYVGHELMFKKVKKGRNQATTLSGNISTACNKKMPGFNLVQVTILESSGRVGGRIRTYYGHGWYGDLGPMRFPPSHLAFRK